MNKLILRRKYGRANPQGISSFVHNPEEELGGIHPNSTPDHVLADYLAEHSDPRELIVRRDLEYRNHPLGWTRGMTEHQDKVINGWGVNRTTHQVDTGDELGASYIPISRYEDKTNSPVAYRWDLHRGSGEGDGEVTHAAILTPEEHHKVLSEFEPSVEEPVKHTLRQYATKTQALPTQTGIPVHKLVHNAMLDAANEAGLIPHDQPGDQQYHTFAKYRDQAHEELSNPDSPFTKMFYRYKAQVHQVPNPREHLKNALAPLFKYLAHGSKSPTVSAGTSGESEPIDLLGGVHHPFDGDSAGFEYIPRLPSGFVAVPPPHPKRKPSPIRNDVYKSIAEHEDMGWSAPDKLKDYLVKKHGITPQEAATHIGNWRRKSKKPTAPTPTATKRVWPPIQRKSRTDNTDLMAIPKRYIRVSDPNTHDGLVSQILHNREEQGLGPFADFLEEQRAPGSRLAREAFHNSQDGEGLSPPFYKDQFWPGNDWDAVKPHWYKENGEHGESLVPEGEIEVKSEISRPYDVGGYRTGLLTVTHGPQTSGHKGELLQYHVPVESRRHLTHLIGDLPEPMRNNLWANMAPHLREDHEQEVSTTGTPSDDEPVKMGGYRAPKPGIIVRGTQYKSGQIIPNLQGSFTNPRRKLSRKYGKILSLIK